jgi:hypothetical protein
MAKPSPPSRPQLRAGDVVVLRQSQEYVEGEIITVLADGRCKVRALVDGIRLSESGDDSHYGGGPQEKLAESLAIHSTAPYGGEHTADDRASPPEHPSPAIVDRGATCARVEAPTRCGDGPGLLRLRCLRAAHPTGQLDEPHARQARQGDQRRFPESRLRKQPASMFAEEPHREVAEDHEHAPRDACHLEHLHRDAFHLYR